VHSRECSVAFGDEVFRCSLRGKLRLSEFGILAGDLVQVSLEGRNYIVEEVLPRRNFLVRPPVANVDQVIVVSAVTEPPVDFLYIDRILVQLEFNEIEGVLCVNKEDLEDPEGICKVVEVYEKAGYPCVITSAVTGFGLERLASYMEGKVTVLAGQSGTGKSKILSSLLGVGLLTGDLSKSGRGRHTTKWVTLCRAKGAGYVADTPGFSRLDLVPCEPEELSYYYREFRPYAPLCHFPRCLHKTEDLCAVKEALGEGKIHPERYRNYLALIEECVERARRKYQ